MNGHTNFSDTRPCGHVQPSGPLLTCGLPSNTCGFIPKFFPVMTSVPPKVEAP